MRDLNKKGIMELQKLMRVKSDTLNLELALSRKILNNTKSQIGVLKESVSNGDSIEALSAITQWQRWRTSEISHLNARTAAMRIEIEQIEEHASKASAEKETIDQISRRYAQKRKSSFKRREELELPSHFLSNNVSDQDI